MVIVLPRAAAWKRLAAGHDGRAAGRALVDSSRRPVYHRSYLPARVPSPAAAPAPAGPTDETPGSLGAVEVALAGTRLSSFDTQQVSLGAGAWLKF